MNEQKEIPQENNLVPSRKMKDVLGEGSVWTNERLMFEIKRLRDELEVAKRERFVLDSMAWKTLMIMLRTSVGFMDAKKGLFQRHMVDMKDFVEKKNDVKKQGWGVYESLLWQKYFGVINTCEQMLSQDDNLVLVLGQLQEVIKEVTRQ